MSGEFDKSENDKICSSKIKIGARINIANIIKASVEIIKNKAKKEAAVSSGDYGNAASSGYGGSAVSSGYKGSVRVEHENACAIAWGPESKAQGVKGSCLVIAEWELNKCRFPYEWEFKGAKMVRVDGKIIKENTWYTMKNGEIVEATDED